MSDTSDSEALADIEALLHVPTDVAHIFQEIDSVVEAATKDVSAISTAAIDKTYLWLLEETFGEMATSNSTSGSDSDNVAAQSKNRGGIFLHQKEIGNAEITTKSRHGSKRSSSSLENYTNKKQKIDLVRSHSTMDMKLARQHFLNPLPKSDDYSGMAVILYTRKRTSPYKYPVARPIYKGPKNSNFSYVKPSIYLKLGMNAKSNECPFLDDSIELSDSGLTYELNKEYRKVMQVENVFNSPNRTIVAVDEGSSNELDDLDGELPGPLFNVQPHFSSEDNALKNLQLLIHVTSVDSTNTNCEEFKIDPERSRDQNLIPKINSSQLCMTTIKPEAEKLSKDEFSSFSVLDNASSVSNAGLETGDVENLTKKESNSEGQKLDAKINTENQKLMSVTCKIPEMGTTDAAINQDDHGCETIMDVNRINNPDISIIDSTDSDVPSLNSKDLSVIYDAANQIPYPLSLPDDTDLNLDTPLHAECFGTFHSDVVMTKVLITYDNSGASDKQSFHSGSADADISSDTMMSVECPKNGAIKSACLQCSFDNLTEGAEENSTKHEGGSSTALNEELSVRYFEIDKICLSNNFMGLRKLEKEEVHDNLEISSVSPDATYLDCIKKEDERDFELTGKDTDEIKEIFVDLSAAHNGSNNEALRKPQSPEIISISSTEEDQNFDISVRSDATNDVIVCSSETSLDLLGAYESSDSEVLFIPRSTRTISISSTSEASDFLARDVPDEPSLLMSDDASSSMKPETPIPVSEDAICTIPNESICPGELKRTLLWDFLDHELDNNVDEQVGVNIFNEENALLTENCLQEKGSRSLEDLEETLLEQNVPESFSDKLGKNLSAEDLTTTSTSLDPRNKTTDNWDADLIKPKTLQLNVSVQSSDSFGNDEFERTMLWNSLDHELDNKVGKKLPDEQAVPNIASNRVAENTLPTEGESSGSSENLQSTLLEQNVPKSFSDTLDESLPTEDFVELSTYANSSDAKHKTVDTQNNCNKNVDEAVISNKQPTEAKTLQRDVTVQSSDGIGADEFERTLLWDFLDHELDNVSKTLPGGQDGPTTIANRVAQNTLLTKEKGSESLEDLEKLEQNAPDTLDKKLPTEDLLDLVSSSLATASTTTSSLDGKTTNTKDNNEDTNEPVISTTDPTEPKTLQLDVSVQSSAGTGPDEFERTLLWNFLDDELDKDVDKTFPSEQDYPHILNGTISNRVAENTLPSEKGSGSSEKTRLGQSILEVSPIAVSDKTEDFLYNDKSSVIVNDLIQPFLQSNVQSSVNGGAFADTIASSMDISNTDDDLPENSEVGKRLTSDVNIGETILVENSNMDEIRAPIFSESLNETQTAVDLQINECLERYPIVLVEKLKESHPRLIDSGIVSVDELESSVNAQTITNSKMYEILGNQSIPLLDKLEKPCLLSTKSSVTSENEFEANVTQTEQPTAAKNGTEDVTMVEKLELPPVSSKIGARYLPYEPSHVINEVYNSTNVCLSSDGANPVKSISPNCTVTSGDYDTSHDIKPTNGSSSNEHNASLYIKPSDLKSNISSNQTIPSKCGTKRPAPSTDKENKQKRYKPSFDTASPRPAPPPAPPKGTRAPRRTLYDFTRPEDCFEAVRVEWGCPYLPNPHEDLTCRFYNQLPPVPNTFNIPGNDVHPTVSCLLVYQDQMANLTQELQGLTIDLDLFGGMWDRRKIACTMERISRLRAMHGQLAKACDEAYHFYKYYKDPNTGWNAGYITDYRQNEVAHQLQILESYESFYGFYKN